MLFFIIFALISFLIGDFVLSIILKVKLDNFYEKIPANLGLGFYCISLLTLILGFTSLLYKNAIIILLSSILIIIIGLMFFFNKKSKQFNNDKIHKKIQLSKFNAFLILTLLGCIFLNTIRCFIPAYYLDSLSYHLAIPKIFFNLHRICELRTIIYSNFPLTMEMIYLIGIAFNKENFAQFVNNFYGILLLSVIFLYCINFLREINPILSISIFYIHPIITYISSSALTDLPLAFYLFLSFYFIEKWGKNPIKNSKLFYISALFSAIALSIKWTSAIFLSLLILTIIMYLIFQKKDIKSIIKNISIYIFIVLLLVLPYLIKNYLFTSNPFFPFFYKYFGGKDFSYEISTNFFNMLRNHGGRGKTTFFLLPYNLTMHEWTFEGVFSPIFLAFVPLLIFVRKKDKYFYKILFLLSFSSIYALLWFLFLPMSIRFLVPIFPFLSIIVSYIFTYFESNLKVTKKLLFLFIIFYIISSFCISIIGESGFADEFNYFIGKETKENFLQRKLGYYKMFNWINHNTKKSDVILLGEMFNQGYYLNRPYLWSHPKFQGVIDYNKIKSGKELYLKFKSLGVKFVVFRHDLHLLKNFYSPHQYKLWNEFLKKYVICSYQDENKNKVYKLLE